MKRALAGLAVVLAAAVGVVALLPGLDLPFGTETKDTSPPALRRALEDLHQYRAASANLQQVVEVEEDAGLLPAFIKGQRTVLVAQGAVDAHVDFRALGPGAVRLSEDGRRATISLPAAQLGEPRVDLERTRVVDRDRGLVDRVGEALGEGGADEERQMLALAEEKLHAAARADRELLRRAERNTTQMLQRLGRGLGLERVDVRYEQAPAV
jgi:hypothetical protein